MKQTISKYFGLLIIPIVLSLGYVQATNAQVAYRFGNKSTMTLAGTSTLHDWTMVAKAFSCNAQMDVTPDNKLNAINSLALVLPIRNLKSEHDGMNDNAYEALKEDNHKDITFKLTSAKITAGTAGKCTIAAQGNLSIAGVTKGITINGAGAVAADGTITITGSVPLKMSEFNVERPSFMFGTMHVGDALTLSYSLILTH